MQVKNQLDKVEQLDLEGFRSINNLVPKWKAINPFMRVVARFGPVLFLIPLAISYVFSRRFRSEKHRQKVSQALVGTVFVYLFNTPFRRIIGRKRPYFVHSGVHRLDPVHHQPSLPSDHATVSFNVARSFRNEPLLLMIPTYLLAALISFGRVYSGEHYPADVLAGAAIGLTIETLVEKNWDSIEDRIEKVVQNKGSH
jgi:undecaprenyl-diphosphatase